MHHELHTEITIDAPTAVVWEILTDLESRLQPPGGRAMTFKPTVTEVEPDGSFEWLGRLGVPGIFEGRHRFELRPTASGRTTFAHSEQFDGVLVRAMRKSLDTSTKAGFEAMNGALKERAEARASNPSS